MEGREIARKFMSKQKNGLRAGDTIRCHDKEDMVNHMMALQKKGIETDFVYEKNGKKGLWLVVTRIK